MAPFKPKKSHKNQPKQNQSNQKKSKQGKSKAALSNQALLKQALASPIDTAQPRWADIVSGATPPSEETSKTDLKGNALLKETCRRIRAAKSLWDAHRNAACRNERDKALALYHQLTPSQKDQVPQQLRIWLRYRSEKYFGAHQTPPGGNQRSGKKRSGQKRVDQND